MNNENSYQRDEHYLNKQDEESIDIFLSERNSTQLYLQRLLFNIKQNSNDIHYNRCSIRFAIIFIYNLVPIYIFYLFFQIRTYREQKKLNSINQSKLFLLTFLDILIALSILFILFCFGYFICINNLDKSLSIYKNWLFNVIIFLIIITFFKSIRQSIQLKQSQNEDAEEEERFVFRFTYQDLLDSNNFAFMGMGYLANNYIKSLYQTEDSIKQQYKEQFFEQLETIIEQDKSDLTLGYIALIQDQVIKKQQKWYKYRPLDSLKEQKKKHLRDLANLTTFIQEQKESLSVIEILKQQGFQGKRSIIQNYLFPLYMQTKQQKEENLSIKYGSLIVMLILKIFVPTVFLNQSISLTIVFITLILIGFYCHIFQMIYDLMDHTDIRTKFFINEELSRIIDIDEYMNEEETTTLDITCTLSWANWNTMRHIALQLDSQIQTNIDFKFWVLVIYGKLCYLAYFKCEFDISSLWNSDYCKESILLYNIHIDIMLIAILSCVRIYQGSLLNDSICMVKEKIFLLRTIFEDLETLFDFYFSQGVDEEINNKWYFAVVKLIKKYVEQKLSRGFIDDEDEEGDSLFEDEQLECAKNRIIELKESIQSISRLVKRDEKAYVNKFMGIMEANVDKISKIFIILGILFLPGLYLKIEDEIDAIG